MESAKKIIGEEGITVLRDPVMGAEDMSYFLNQVEGTYFYLSNTGKVDGEYYPQHNSKFDLDESQIWKSVALFIQATLDYLND